MRAERLHEQGLVESAVKRSAVLLHVPHCAHRRPGKNHPKPALRRGPGSVKERPENPRQRRCRLNELGKLIEDKQRRLSLRGMRQMVQRIRPVLERTGGQIAEPGRKYRGRLPR